MCTLVRPLPAFAVSIPHAHNQSALRTNDDGQQAKERERTHVRMLLAVWMPNDDGNDADDDDDAEHRKALE